jgi:predicted ribosome quality control (RQC) complex YloA/Tae2 family protein
MKQSYLELERFVKEYNEMFLRHKGLFGRIAQIYSTPHWICLVTRFPGKKRYYYFGRGHNFSALVEGERVPPVAHRIKDRFLEYLRSHLVGSAMAEMFLDEKSRMVGFAYGPQQNRNMFLFLWAGQRLFFANVYEAENKDKIIFLPWSNSKKILAPAGSMAIDEMWKRSKEFFKELIIDEHRSNNEAKECYPSRNPIEEYFENYLSKVKPTSPAWNKQIKFLQKKAHKIKEDLLKLGKWKEIQNEIQKNDFIFPEEIKWTHQGINFKFIKSMTHYQKMNFVFEKIKSWRKAEEKQIQRLNECLNQIEIVKSTETVPIRDVPITPVWDTVKKGGSSHKKDLHLTGLNTKFFRWQEKISLAIGLDSTGNDYLRKTWASKNDYWFHLENRPGPHCFVKIKNTEDLNQDFVTVVASLLRDMAKLELLQIAMVYTQVKNLRAVKGTPGMVTYKKERHIRIDYNPEWRNLLLSVDKD